jgi:hypothetical protein
VERLAAVLEPDYVPVWLNRPLAALGTRTWGNGVVVVDFGGLGPDAA